jgi:hypothetical protein
VLSIEEPPDLEPIVADYQRPSGRLSDAAMPRLAARVEQTFASLSRNDGFRFADALVSAMTPSASDLDIDRQFGVDLDGVRPLARDELVATLEADLTCSGTSSSPDEASGEVRVLGAVDRFEGGSLQLESLVIETRVELDDATFVIGFAETQLLSFLPRTLSFIVRASDGLWVCTSLVGAGVGACEDQITGGRVTW